MPATVHVEYDVTEDVARKLEQVIALSRRGDVFVAPAGQPLTLAVLAARLGRTNAETDDLARRAGVQLSRDRFGVPSLTAEQVEAVYAADRQDCRERADRFHDLMVELGASDS
jgi:hypothetical protein